MLPGKGYLLLSSLNLSLRFLQPCLETFHLFPVPLLCLPALESVDHELHPTHCGQKPTFLFRVVGTGYCVSAMSEVANGILKVKKLENH